MYDPSPGNTSTSAPLSPQTPTGSSAYQVNVNRTKTKKWVEAKVQSYDGDDWGTDDYDDQESEEEVSPPLPKVTTHTAGSREATLPSLQTQRHPVILTPDTTSQSRSATGQWPVVSGASSSASPYTYPKIVSPQVVNTARSFGDLARRLEKEHPTRTPDLTTVYEQEKRASLVSSSDVGSRVGEENGKERPSPDLVDTRPGAVGRDGPFQAVRKAETPIRSMYNDDDRRISLSPKLPDLARMSAFGTDLFYAGTACLPRDEPIAEQGSESESPASPPAPKAEVVKKAAVVGTPTETQEGKERTERESHSVEPLPLLASAVSQNIAEAEETNTERLASPTTPPASRTLSKETIPVLQPDSNMHAIAPLRTPSPRGPAQLIPNTSETLPDDTRPMEAATVEPTEHGPEAKIEPIAIQREDTFSTVASSMLRDNDMLSDEILKSLSPVGNPVQEVNRAAPGQASQSSNHIAAENSSYTLQDYRSYWEEVGDKSDKREASAPIPAIPELPDVQSEPASQSTTNAIDEATQSLVSPPSATLRRRFSWEAEERSPASTQRSPTVPQPSAIPTHGLEVERPAVEYTKSQVDDSESKDEVSKVAGATPQVSSGGDPLPRDQQPGLEVCSPLSPVSENSGDGSRVRSGFGPEENKAPGRPKLSLVSTVTAAENQPALTVQTSPPDAAPLVASDSQQAQAQTVSFREIMSMDSSRERIAKYNEMRSIFSSTNSGLDSWLVYLDAQHPDMGPLKPLVVAQAARQASQGADAAKIMAGAQAVPAQQPYYQQYLNASSPTASGFPTGRSRLGGLPITLPSQVSSSTFGHSSNQIGTKSKEFMHSAGKMGKGLLSKGRSKLRGTGDKSWQAKSLQAKSKQAKADRRSSWGVLISQVLRQSHVGPKPRPRSCPDQHAHEAAPPASANAQPAISSSSNSHATQQRAAPDAGPDVASSSMAPQIPLVAPAAPLSPLNPAAHSEQVPEWRPGTIEAATLTLRHPVPPAQAQALALAPAQAQSQAQAQAQLGHPSRATAGLSRLEIPDSASLGFDGATTAPALSSQKTETVQGQPTGCDARGLDTATAERAMEQASAGPAPSAPVPQDSGAVLTPPTEHTARGEEPKRSSSFIGLPPIRRSSTFGLTPKSRARRVTDRFPIDDDDDGEDAEPPIQGLSVDAATHSAHDLEPQAAANHLADPSTNQDKTQPDASRWEADPETQQGAAARQPQHPPQLQAPSATTANQTQDTQGSQPSMPPSSPPGATLAGQWKLEESRLSEPLNPVSRNRSGTAGSQQIMYGFDKETGMSSPDLAILRPGPDQMHQPLQHHPPNPVTPPPRQRSDVPPSSAQRWPELFAYPPDRRPGPIARNGGLPSQSPYQHPLAYNEFVMPRSEASEFAIPGVGPLPEEGGHRHKGSGMLKDFGQRIARATSRERRSPVDQRAATAGPRGDEASESSVVIGGELPERGRRRPSYLFGRSGRPSVDPGPRQHIGTGQEQLPREDRPPSTLPPGGKRRSLLAGGIGVKLLASRLSKSSLSIMEQIQDASPATQPSQVLNDTVPPKKRFSGMPKVSNLLGRNKHDDRPYPQQAEADAEALEPPAPPFIASGRPSTSSSMSSSPEGWECDSPGRRGRRPSMSALITGMLGKRSASKTRETDQPLASESAFHQQSSMYPQPQIMLDAQGQTTEQYQRQYPHCPDQVNQPPQHVAQSSPPRNEANAKPLPMESFHPSGMSVDSSVRFVKPPQPSPLGLVPRNPHQQMPPDPDPALEPDNEGLSQQQEQLHISPSTSIAPEKPRAVLVESHIQSDCEAHSSATTEGEMMRTSTVSPDLSITSDWKATEDDADGGDADEARTNGSIDLSGERDFTVIRQSKQQYLEDVQQTKEITGNGSVEKAVPVAAFVQHNATPPPPPPPPSATEEPHKPEISQGPAEENGRHPRQDMATRQLFPRTPGSRMPHPDYSRPSCPEHFACAQSQENLQQMQQPHPGLPTQGDGSMATRGPAAQYGVMEEHQYKPQPGPQSGPLKSHQARVSHKEALGSKWKGLTKRMSEQMAHFGHQSAGQEKPDKAERSTGNRLRGAFKRNPKQAESTRQSGFGPVRKGDAVQATDQWHNLQQAQPQLCLQRQGEEGFANVQGPSQLQPLNPNNIPVPPRLQGHKMPHDNPVQPSATTHARPEPQYDYVPIPRAYTAVHGEGMMAPTAYNVGRHHHHHQANQTQIPQQFGQQAPTRMLPQQHPLQQLQRAVSPPVSQTSFPCQDSVSSFGVVHSPSAPSAPSVPSLDEQRTSSRLDDARGNTTRATLPAPVRNPPPVAAVESREQDSPQPQLTNTYAGKAPTEDTVVSRSASGTGPSSQQSKSPIAQVESSPPHMEPTAETPDRGAVRSAKSNVLGVDVDKALQHHDEDIYDATPRLNETTHPQDLQTHGTDRRVSEHSPAEKCTCKAGLKTSNDFTAELEDTANAHERRVRLESQEEKIWLDPEDDPNYVPQMSATSYPGQEWNPYGDPDFSE
ncbi:hypothetical protein ED733_003710 [Metarhizium rileyi]|uniref:Uncharacterized protein n=1 Tax=Metarhizium rileyi (strain RCEF 4871) TaxID=1649241 RepID=A0A5C6G9C2_METRR|nr:hypothetical protein ED733_003710 [Metarhizium rileyi]